MLPEPSSDLCDLVRQAQAGSNDAAQKVYDQCKEPLLRAIRSVLYKRVRSQEDSNDFLQDAFVVIFTKHFSDAVLRSPKGLMAYMKRIAVNKVRNETQRLLFTQRYGISKEVSLDLQKEFTAESKEVSPEDALALQELAAEWWGVEFSQLTPECKEVTRFALGGDGARRMTAALGMKPEAVKRLIAQVKAALQN
jgi:DNA-directed RNA polymerase specialized sigma24 family protein